MYKLIAFDMDGTLLRPDKTISEESKSAIHEAVEAGKIVAICSGRPVCELRPYEKDFADIRYLVSGCGSLIFDRREKKILARHTMNPDLVDRVLEVTTKEDMMPQVLQRGESHVQADDLENMPHFHMAIYIGLYHGAATPEKDIRAYIRENREDIEKINLYHATLDGRERTRARLSSLPLDLTDSEESSLEVSTPGIDKGTGLLDLARALSIDPSEVIAVGDAYNDLPMIRAAGLGLVMGNGADDVKPEGDAVLPDNEHEGAAYAIRHYLLERA